VTNDERGSDKEKEIEIERGMLISRTLAAALKASQPKKEEEEDYYKSNKELKRRFLGE
jgi:hypothetical protein